MKRRFSLSITLICAGIIAPFSASPVSAVETVKISHERYEEFVTGKADGVTLTQDGTIILSPALKKLTDLSSDYLWDAVYDANGNLYVATGDKGKVWKITPDGQASEFFKGEGVNVFAIAMNKKGQLHIATSPDGKVLRLDTNGQSTVYFDCKEKNIFALLFDDQDQLYVATGDKGIIYKVTGENRAEVFFDSDEPNIVSLAWDNKGRLLAGSQGSGLLYRIDPSSPSPYVLLSSNQKEVKRMIVRPDGGIFVLVLDGLGVETPAAEVTPSINTFPNPMNPQGPPVPNPAPMISAPGMETGLPGQVESGAPGKGGASELYFLAPDGLPRQIWTSKFTGHSLALKGEHALVGTGDDGYLFEIDSQGRASLIVKVSSGQITKLVTGSDGKLSLLGSNPGAVWSLSKDKNKEGVYESDVFNSNFFVRWGAFDVTGNIPEGSSVSVQTRSGNTSSPDKSWSEWKPLDKTSVTSPSAQYLQYRLELKGSPDLTVNDVAFFYQPFNLPPVISSVEVISSTQTPFPIQFNAPGMTPAMVAAQLVGLPINRNTPQPAPPGDMPAQMPMMQQPKAIGAPARGLHLAFWNASDPNQDPLLFKVFYKSEGDESWHLLDENLDIPFFMWDTTGWPDGNYTLRIEANDSLSNAPAEVKTAEDTSRRFQIDNTPPVMSGLQVNGRQATFTVSDNLSVIKSVTVSTDGIHYLPLAPVQGILDSKQKSFLYTAPDLVNRVFIRMEDADGNIGAAAITFK